MGKICLEQNVAMGIVQSVLVALLLAVGAALLWRYKARVARIGAFMLLTLAVYLSWIVRELFEDTLGPENYTAAITLSRFAVIGGSIHMLIVILRDNPRRAP